MPMLLWEALRALAGANVVSGPDSAADAGNPSSEVKRAIRGPRMPHDKRCSALTRKGKRCRGKIREGSEFCSFHEPTLTTERRRLNAAKGGRSKRSLAHIPGGYLRSLTNRESIGHAMDRLYREVRVGAVTPEMGRVLLDVLSRMLDTGLSQGRRKSKTATGRSRAERLRPKLNDLLTRAEKVAWQKAVNNAPAAFVNAKQQEYVESQRQEQAAEQNRKSAEASHNLPMQAAS